MQCKMAGDPPQRKRKAMSETLFAAGSGSHSLFLTLFRHIERSIFTDFCPNVSLSRRFRVTSKSLTAQDMYRQEEFVH
ncbi:hypothetical protein LSH36_89g05048 [Paralvinella palmiformis]|uniref:Uncharacterized protein n=1 Tax=Paralvinella palmiformis TaxID=53620 RepID=A0AAD9NC97_9ANNE|nr:hypothetical protein LSH36_89g05048 [Paralvinella palmiformis]